MTIATKLLTFTALTFAAPSMAANVIVNGGFESGVLSPWFQDNDLGGPEAWNVTNADAHSGTFSATDVGNKEIRQNFAPVPVSSITEATFWLKHPTAPNLPAFVTLFYNDNTNTGFLVNTAGTGWEQFNVLGNLAAGKLLSGFSVYGYIGGTDPNRTFLDDVVIAANTVGVPEPAAWAMMIAGFGLAGAVTRRRMRIRVAFA